MRELSSYFIPNSLRCDKKEEQLSQKIKLSNVKLSVSQTSIQILSSPKILNFCIPQLNSVVFPPTAAHAFK